MKEKYDTFKVQVPKGQKIIIEEHRKNKGYKSLNAYVNDLIKKDMEKHCQRTEYGVFVIWNMHQTHNRKTILTIKPSGGWIRLSAGETVRQYRAMPGRSLRSRHRAWLAKLLDLGGEIMLP